MDGDLRILFRRNIPAVHWLSVETAGTEAGVPDMNGCYGGREFWVETKACTANAVRIAPAQVGWHSRRHRAGGSSFFAVRRKREALLLFSGKHAEKLRDGGLSSIPALGSWEGGPSSWDWLEVLYLLCL
jgi:hypothetical protein